MTKALKAGDELLPIWTVSRVHIADLENEIVTIYCGNTAYRAEGFDAIEAIWVFKPSALEGRRLKWRWSAWAFHNIVAHPALQVLAWMGFKKAAVRFHDWTTPRPRAFKNSL